MLRSFFLALVPQSESMQYSMKQYRTGSLKSCRVADVQIAFLFLVFSQYSCCMTV